MALILPCIMLIVVCIICLYNIVSSPNVIISYDGPLLAGERLELTCSITVPGGLVQGTQVSARLLRGDERELKRVEQDAYKLEHVFEALSLEDSDVYKCEATITSQHAGVLATSSQSMDITVLGSITNWL